MAVMKFEERVDYLAAAIVQIAAGMDGDRRAFAEATDEAEREAALKRIYSASASLRTAAFNLVRVSGERLQGLS
jgi:hypothetical protein